MGMKDWIIPQDKLFFNLLEESAENVRDGAEFLVHIVENYDDLKNKCHKMKAIEHKGDEITHSIYNLLNTTFITPIEPNEISLLASSLDDILDYIDGATRMMYLYGIPETDRFMVEFSKLILISAEELLFAVKGIRDLKHPKGIEERCIEINRLENLGDDLLGEAIQEIFRCPDAIRLIKYKDIYEKLEDATDRCETAANVLSDIAIRHS
jgi:uncharacterized protein Yka (UPF0111/DUF47 family)